MRHLQLALVDFSKTNNSMTVGRRNCQNISYYCAAIAFLELYPIVVAAVLWGKQWSGEKILFYCHNIATVPIIKNDRSKEPFIMKLMRHLTMCVMLNNFAIFSEHVPGSINCIADALTRFQIQRFREFATGGSNST